MEARSPSQLLARAWELYKKNPRAFLLTAGIALVPVALIHAAIASAVLPNAAELNARGESIQRDSEELQRRAAAGTLTPDDAARLQRQIAEQFGRARTEMGSAMGGFALFTVSMLLLAPIAALGAFLGSAALVPMVRDAETGRSLSPAGAWSEVRRRFPQLIVTAILAAVLVAVGFFLFVIPGFVLAFLFALAMPVAVIEGRSGLAALKRSAEIVRRDWVRAAILLIAFILLSLVAHLIAGVIVPPRFAFAHNLAQDIATWIVFPLPIAGLVLLYLDQHVAERIPASAGDLSGARAHPPL
jgi:hypothetical protein